MKSRRPCCVVIEDEDDIRQELCHALEAAGLDAYGFENGETFLGSAPPRFLAAFVDLHLSSQMTGYELLREIGSRWPESLVVVVSAWVPEASDMIDAMTDGPAVRLVRKGVPGYVQRAVSFALSYRKLFADHRQSEELVDDEKTRAIVDLLPILARDDGPVLLLGPTGAGKEWFAERIHRRARRTSALWRPVNCAAWSDELLASELFGHVRGAFTGADSHRLGIFLEASGACAPYEPGGRQSVKRLAEALRHVFGSAGTGEQFWREIQNAQLDSVLKTVVSIRRESEKLVRAAASEEYIGWLQNDNVVVPVRHGNGRNELVRMGRTYAIVERHEAEYLALLTADESYQGRSGVGTPGTLFLDEVGDLRPPAQAALLRVLDGRGILPLGYRGPPLLPNVRVMAATNRIRSMRDVGAKDGFREDLYWRLARWVVDVPPVTSCEAIRGLAQDFAAQHNRVFEPEAMDALLRRAEWRGNWREVEHVILRALALSKPPRVNEADVLKAAAFALAEDNSRSSGRPVLVDMVRAISNRQLFEIPGGRVVDFLDRELSELEARAFVGWLHMNGMSWPEVAALLGPSAPDSLRVAASRKYGVTPKDEKTQADVKDLVSRIIAPILSQDSERCQ